MSNLRLFSARACPFAHRTRLVLAHKALEFELVEIDLQNKPSWFSEVSLYGKVPALEHDGHRIVESAIINEYIDEVFPSAQALLPKDPVPRALARIWIDFANTRLAPAFGKLLRGATEVEREGGRRELSDVLARVEREGLSKLSPRGPFWLGTAPSLVDFTFYPWFERLPALHHYFRFAIPKDASWILRWRDAMEALPIVRAIANPTEFYVDRYRTYVSPQVLTAN
jgi:glutathione S-transferase